MLQNKFSVGKHKKQLSVAKPEKLSQELDESDMDFYKNVMQNLTPKNDNKMNLETLGRRMSENLACNKDIQNCIYLEQDSRKKKKSLVLSSKEHPKQFKTLLNNHYKSKASLLNKNFSKRNIEINKSAKDFKKTKKSQKKVDFPTEQNSINNEELTWKMIEEMEEDQLKIFIENITQFYEKKFSKKFQENTKVEEVDDSQMTKKNPLANCEDNKKNENNQINKLRVELEEIKTMIKKMNN